MKNLFIWIGSFFEEDNGKASMKRLLAFILCMLVVFVVAHIVMKSITPEATTFSEVILGLVFSFVAVLLSLSFIPSVTGKTRDQDPPADQK